MIERNFVRESILKQRIHNFIVDNLRERSVIRTDFKKTPLGERIIIYSTLPGVVVGRKGRNISDLTKKLKDEFELENPQVEVAEIENQDLDAKAIAQKIAYTLERYGPKRFKGVMHKSAEGAMRAGAKGVEIIINGKVPSARSRSWRVYHGYLKKCGDLALSQVRSATETAFIKAGAVGISVKIMPPDVQLPDEVSEKIIEEEGFDDLKEGSSGNFEGNASSEKKSAPEEEQAENTGSKESKESKKSEKEEEETNPEEKAKVAKEIAQEEEKGGKNE